jgi:hypothetical protein
MAAPIRSPTANNTLYIGIAIFNAAKPALPTPLPINIVSNNIYMYTITEPEMLGI